MSEFLWSDAWLLLAAKYAAGDSDSATEDSVMAAGDFINHTSFLPGELDHGHECLAAADLLHRTGEMYQLGAAFPEFWRVSGAERHRSVHKQLEKVVHALGAT